MQSESPTIQRAAELLQKLRAEIAKAVVGQDAVVEQVVVSLICSGHVLIEGMPGLGKTLLVRALAQALSLDYGRVQFTPDLMPSDVTGHAVLDPNTRELRVVRGPVFTNILLADEINRAPAKTQSSLLELMQEYQVTLEGQTLALPRPFMVLATQNPIETEGTYALPEAQLDRFLLKVLINYPSETEEIAVIRRATGNSVGDQLPLGDVKPCLNEAAVLALQQIVAHQRVDDSVVEYAVRIARASRDWPGIALGCGSRGAIALIRAARAQALIAAREFVTPDDVKRMVAPALRHRIALAPDTQLEGRQVDDALAEVAASVAAPRS